MGKRRCVGPGPLIDPSRIPTPHFLVVLTAVTQSIAYRILARRSHAVRKRAEAGLAREASLRARARAVTSRANAVQVRARAITVRVNAIAPQGTEAVSVPEIEGIEMVIPDSRSAREREGRSPWTGTFITVVPSAGLSNSMHYDPANTWRVLTRARGEIEDARAGVERLERMLDDAERAIVEGERVLDETEGALRHTEAFLGRFAGRIEERWRRSREVGREEVAGERQDRAEVRAEDEEIEGEVDRVLGVFEGALRIAQEATEKEEK